MASTHSITASLRQWLADTLLEGTLKLALYTEDATLSSATTVYTTTNEASGTGYTAGGATVSPSTSVLSGGKVAVYLPTPVSWPGSAFTFRYGLLYDSSDGNRALGIYDFGMTYTAVTQTVSLDFPATPSQALLVF